MLRGILDKIQHWIYKKLNKDTNEIQKTKRGIPYTNKPITEESVDEIGMGVYVEYLESAIENGADMIAVVSDFGTGKSSLIELLKEKYHGWSQRGNGLCERVYCQVNLWSQLANEKEETLELHRAFLYQLISTVYPHKSSYFSRRTGRNFGIFKISAESKVWSVFINLAIIVLVAVAMAHYFSASIIDSGLMSGEALGLMILLGYLFCGIVVLLLLVKTEIIFSSKSSDGKRQIEENELIDLYREHILSSRHWYSPLWNFLFGTKHIVVVIEDLDRTENGKMVYHFLKEIKKYYVPNEQLEKNFNNHISFIVNIMPEDMLHKLCNDPAEDNKYVYDKIFDYTMNLNRINIDNFDAVLEALIQEKAEELTKLGIGVGDSDNVHQIAGMQWIILGKQLSLRQVKERLNDTMVLYESLVQKFGIESVEFSKCAAVAYLRSAFSKEFYQLSDRMLEEMVTWYAKEQRTEEEFINEHKDDTDFEAEFLKTLYQMIEAHLIDGNYRSYFFNYPKNSNLYNIQETRVRNMIVYNEDMTEEIKADIVEVAKTKPEVIVEAMQKAVELVSQLPKEVLFSSELWNIAEKKFPVYLVSLVSKFFSDISEVTKENYKILDSVIGMPNSSKMLCQTIRKNETETIVAIRDYILDKHIAHIVEYIPLFNLQSAPLDKEELQKMEGTHLSHILDMVKDVVGSLDSEVIDQICQSILLEKEPEVIEKAEGFYEELLENYSTESVAEDVTQYMILRQRLIPGFEEEIYKAVDKEELDAEYYFNLMNRMPLSEIQDEQMERIIALDKPGAVTEEICHKMKAENEDKAYLLNMAAISLNRLELTWEEFQDVMENEGESIWKEHSDLFRKIRFWACTNYKDSMVELGDFFKLPYPMVTSGEMENFTLPEVVFELYDADRVDEDEGDVFVEFCNRQFRKGPIAFAIFSYIAEMQKEMIPKVFYKIDMHKVRFALMSAINKSQIVEKLRLPLKLSTSKAIVEFMNFTECLIPELEQEIIVDLKGSNSEDLCMAYIKIAQKYGKVTKETIKNLLAMPSIYQYGEMLNEELYKRKIYKRYVCSKTQEMGKFEIEYEKLDVLWKVYLEIFKSPKAYQSTQPRMCQNRAFLEMVQNREAYTELPEESRMALASIEQDENTLRDVLNYSDEFVLEYFSAIAGFTSKTAAEAFVSIMEKHQKYAQNKKVYDNVYHKLENSQLKSKYTKLHHRANS